MPAEQTGGGWVQTIAAGVAAVLGVLGFGAALVRQHGTQHRGLREASELGDRELRDDLHAQELHCAQTSSQVLARLGAVEKKQDAHTSELKAQTGQLGFLVAWAKQNGGHNAGGDT